MPMRLEGSCRCGAASFALLSHTPQPFQLCYCSICRKTAGGGGYAINLGGVAGSLEVRGRRALRCFHASIDGARSEAERWSCGRCGTALWLFDPRWPELLHPLASAIDTALPVPPARAHIMLGSRASWVRPDVRRGDERFEDCPTRSIEDWHRERGLWVA